MEINGIEYRKKDLKKPSKGVLNLMSMAEIYGGYKFGGNNLEGVSIIEEFRLIQDKKSKLSKAKRDSVVFEFNRRYEEI
jgi:hypothetical protein